MSWMVGCSFLDQEAKDIIQQSQLHADSWLVVLMMITMNAGLRYAFLIMV